MHCRFFGREIAAYDIQTKRCDVYGQDEGHSERVMLVYDGLHYDALAVAGESYGTQQCLLWTAHSAVACNMLRWRYRSQRKDKGCSERVMLAYIGLH